MAIDRPPEARDRAGFDAALRRPLLRLVGRVAEALGAGVRLSADEMWLSQEAGAREQLLDRAYDRLRRHDGHERAEAEVLVKVHAVSHNASDWEVLRGKPMYSRIAGPFRPRHHIPGSDIAGRVEAVGRPPIIAQLRREAQRPCTHRAGRSWRRSGSARSALRGWKARSSRTHR